MRRTTLFFLLAAGLLLLATSPRLLAQEGTPVFLPIIQAHGDAAPLPTTGTPGADPTGTLPPLLTPVPLTPTVEGNTPAPGVTSSPTVVMPPGTPVTPQPGETPPPTVIVPPGATITPTGVGTSPVPTTTAIATITAIATTMPSPTVSPTVSPTGPPPGTPPATPAVPPSSDNLNVNAATYLGGAGDDEATALDVALDGTLLVAGRFPGYTRDGVVPVALLGGGEAAIVRLSNDGQRVIGITRLGNAIRDLEVGANGEMVVCGDFGVALLNAAVDAVTWRVEPGEVKRCALGSSDGGSMTVAALVGNRAYVYDSAGNPVADFGVGGSTQHDLAVDGARGLVVATGFAQDNGAPCSQLQIAFVRAYSFAGDQQWRSYGWNKSEAGGKSLCADTRGLRVSIGRDGALYFAGESAGGNSIFQREPQNLDGNPSGDRLVKTDKYHNPFNTSSNHITFYARLDGSNGALLKGQFVLARLSSDKGNTIRPRAITADASGRVYVAGISACCTANRAAQQLSGQAIPDYSGGEGFLLIVSPDFTQRLHWTPFSGGGDSLVAVRNGSAAFATTMEKGEMITFNALQPSPATLDDSFVAAWAQSME